MYQFPVVPLHKTMVQSIHTSQSVFFSALFWSPPSSHKIGIKLLPIYIILIIYVCVVFLCLCKETQQHFDVFLFFKLLLLLYVQYFCPSVKNQ